MYLNMHMYLHMYLHMHMYLNMYVPVLSHQQKLIYNNMIMLKSHTYMIVSIIFFNLLLWQTNNRLYFMLNVQEGTIYQPPPLGKDMTQGQFLSGV